MIKFENSFHKLNTDFYENVIPSKPPKPELISFNKSLSNLLGIRISWIESIEGIFTKDTGIVISFISIQLRNRIESLLI